ncbi:MAG: DEAD/DEAH box helicase family protein [Desulfuromonadaceae bacterium]|nr:DEAD/DEAH box helicase family protein [Desulfuromonadaceae bacterium]MDD2848482.1 DEAD/DEAH box helicase family protein [Desulfuromonadaceae bacterium]MDD4129889.1 DEAD/DEAH box helicase family protein [Desulfuromonadaceae bacterium]
MSNFTFLQQDWPELYETAREAEQNVNSAPRTSCFYARRSLERAVKWLYANDSYLKQPYADNLAALIHEPTFRENLEPCLFPKILTIQKIGNLAVHSDKPISNSDSLHTLKELFHVLYWLARSYSPSTTAIGKQLFNITCIPQKDSTVADRNAEQLAKLQAEQAEKDTRLAAREAELARTIEEVEALKARIQEFAERKERNKQIIDDHDYSEAETRNVIIDLYLREVGWDLTAPDVLEYPVVGMPNDKGEGFVDYVLWGDDGLPLAVVEAKRTRKDSRIGQQQAKLYADCLERMKGQRPIIFFTNGYETWLWDDLNYPPRKVQGFYKKDELQLLINRRTSIQEITSATINKAIVERPYQYEAIRRTAEDFQRRKLRKALLVMATGTGKTRTVIALIELLQKCNWIKRVLFLADRTALLTQAGNAFKEHLPHSSPVNITKIKDDTTSRIVLSTYPTMMNCIDEAKGGNKRFSPGHFDLIVIDEAHRSVYQKFRAIFEYFDALLLGLTATPRSEVDRNTYSLFELERGVPTFYYELEKAVADGFLVPPKAHSVPLKFQREGVKYNDLSPEEQAEYEEKFWDEENGGMPEKIESSALNNWLFNIDTVDKVLEHLMRYGVKVAGGDRLGKTIIFAKNHNHALFIQERFDKSYPHLKGRFCRVIDNYETYAQTLIEDFSQKESDPVIAISVDMLDTGIDVPEIVNLVFFKLVRSKTKFHQMMGRGTRLCKDLFGPGLDKENFYVFDYCQNFEFFAENPEGIEGSSQESLGKKIFKQRLNLLLLLQQPDIPTGDGLQRLRGSLEDVLHGEVTLMNPDNFIVRPHRRHLEKYAVREHWSRLTAEDELEVTLHLAGLPAELPQEDETAKRFDLLMLNLQLALLEKSGTFSRNRDKVMEIAVRLEGKGTIPMVARQMELILDLQTESYWSGITLPLLEDVRVRLRALIKFLDKGEAVIVYTDFEDTIGEQSEIFVAGYASAEEMSQYRLKVERFIRDNANHITINKLRMNRQITKLDLEELERLLFTAEEVGNRERFEKVFGHQQSLGAFIRKLVGLDRGAASEAFGEFLQNTTYSAAQIRFIDQVVSYLTQNGTMDPGLLYEPPFTDIHNEGLDGVFGDAGATKIIHLLEEIGLRAAA